MRAMLVFLALLWAWPAEAAVSVTSANSASDTTFAAVTSVNITISASAGDTVCVGADVGAASRTFSVTDDKSGGSNTYTQYATAENGTDKEGWILCSINIAGAITQVTPAVSSTVSGNSHAVVWVVAGARTSAYTPNSNSGTATLTSHTTNAVTYGGTNNSAFLGFSGHTGGGTFTIDGTFTSNYSGVGGIYGYRLNNANTTMTNTTAGNRVSVSMMVEIQEASGAAAVNFFPRRLQVQP